MAKTPQDKDTAKHKAILIAHASSFVDGVTSLLKAANYDVLACPDLATGERLSKNNADAPVLYVVHPDDKASAELTDKITEAAHDKNHLYLISQREWTSEWLELLNKEKLNALAWPLNEASLKPVIKGKAAPAPKPEAKPEKEAPKAEAKSEKPKEKKKGFLSKFFGKKEEVAEKPPTEEKKESKQEASSTPPAKKRAIDVIGLEDLKKEAPAQAKPAAKKTAQAKKETPAESLKKEKPEEKEPQKPAAKKSAKTEAIPEKKTEAKSNEKEAPKPKADATTKKAEPKDKQEPQKVEAAKQPEKEKSTADTSAPKADTTSKKEPAKEAAKADEIKEAKGDKAAPKSEKKGFLASIFKRKDAPDEPAKIAAPMAKLPPEKKEEKPVEPQAEQKPAKLPEPEKATSKKKTDQQAPVKEQAKKDTAKPIPAKVSPLPEVKPARNLRAEAKLEPLPPEERAKAKIDKAREEAERKQLPKTLLGKLLYKLKKREVEKKLQLPQPIHNAEPAAAIAPPKAPLELKPKRSVKSEKPNIPADIKQTAEKPKTVQEQKTPEKLEKLENIKEPIASSDRKKAIPQPLPPEERVIIPSSKDLPSPHDPRFNIQKVRSRSMPEQAYLDGPLPPVPDSRKLYASNSPEYLARLSSYGKEPPPKHLHYWKLKPAPIAPPLRYPLKEIVLELKNGSLAQAYATSEQKPLETDFSDYIGEQVEIEEGIVATITNETEFDVYISSDVFNGWVPKAELFEQEAEDTTPKPQPTTEYVGEEVEIEEGVIAVITGETDTHIYLHSDVFSGWINKSDLSPGDDDLPATEILDFEPEKSTQ